MAMLYVSEVRSGRKTSIFLFGVSQEAGWGGSVASSVGTLGKVAKLSSFPSGLPLEPSEKGTQPMRVA